MGYQQLIGLHNYLSVVQVILPEIAEYDVMVQIKACGLSRIDTKVNNLSPSTDNITFTFSIQYSVFVIFVCRPSLSLTQPRTRSQLDLKLLEL